jgi:serine/threonine protein kinase
MKIHQRSIVHRDLKPDNIVIGVDKESDKIHLIDFGISKLFKDIN